eukprot:1236045-Alexandrium_andersonii.AAC.1
MLDKCGTNKLAVWASETSPWRVAVKPQAQECELSGQGKLRDTMWHPLACVQADRAMLVGR